MQATFPARLYGCPDVRARERTAVFGRAWLLAWFQSRLAEVHA